MKALDLDSSLSNRQELAQELGYTGDKSDSSAINIWLHGKVIAKLKENGGRVPSELSSTRPVKRYQALRRLTDGALFFGRIVTHCLVPSPRSLEAAIHDGSETTICVETWGELPIGSWITGGGGDSGDKHAAGHNTTLTLSRPTSFERTICLIVELGLSPSELNARPPCPSSITTL